MDCFFEGLANTLKEEGDALKISKVVERVALLGRN